MVGSAAPPYCRLSDGFDAPTLMGCGWMVFRHGASAFESTDGNISPAAVAPMSSSTCGSFGCTGVLVITCQNCVWASRLAGICAHGAAAVYCWPPMDIDIGVIVGSTGWTI